MNKKLVFIVLLIFFLFVIGLKGVYSQTKITLISVYDNYKHKNNLKSDWGFASLIKTPEDQILFDTGADSAKLLFNMQKLGIAPDSISKVFISHIHGDHLGGLSGFLGRNHNVTVFLPNSFPQSVGDMIINKGARLVKISGPKKISEHIYSTGELDGPPHEQSLIIDSKKGLIIMTGCAHPGIARIIRKSIKIMNNKNVYLALGGFHRPSPSIIQEFKELDVKKVAPSHCTGDLFRNKCAQQFKENFIEFGAGKVITIE
jgi:7,8-dihydropterin-6-yl-methyl-4-(beta-D-ribofuranosyl)aminobenzene 5'-phosphate synthase